MLCATPLSHPYSSSDTSSIIHIKTQSDVKMNNKYSQHKIKAGRPVLPLWSLHGNVCMSIHALRSFRTKPIKFKPQHSFLEILVEFTLYFNILKR